MTARTTARYGAALATSARVTGFLRDGERVTGVRVRRQPGAGRPARPPRHRERLRRAAAAPGRRLGLDRPAQRGACGVPARPRPGRVAGGKYSTYRVMAKDTVDEVAKGLQAETGQPVPPSVTAETPLLGWTEDQRLREVETYRSRSKPSSPPRPNPTTSP